MEDTEVVSVFERFILMEEVSFTVAVLCFSITFAFTPGGRECDLAFCLSNDGSRRKENQV